MKYVGVSAELVQVSNDYTTAESYVLLQPDGERSIIMASGATSLIMASMVERFFDSAIQRARMVTTEISQVDKHTRLVQQKPRQWRGMNER